MKLNHNEMTREMKNLNRPDFREIPWRMKHSLSKRWNGTYGASVAGSAVRH